MKQNGEGWAIYFKQYEKVNNEDKPIVRTVPYQNMINIEGANSAKGTREVMELFNGKYFDYPKPLSLMMHLQNMILKDNDKNKKPIFVKNKNDDHDQRRTS